MTLPKARGVSRMVDEPRAILVGFERPLTDDELRELHDFLNSGTRYVHGGPLAEIASERQRQRDKEGWSNEHDDEHLDESLAMAAACYATPESNRRYRVQRDLRDVYSSVPVDWPFSWHGKWWKPKDRRRDLVRAAALIVAELERLDRLTDISGERT